MNFTPTRINPTHSYGPYNVVARVSFAEGSLVFEADRHRLDKHGYVFNLERRLAILKLPVAASKLEYATVKGRFHSVKQIVVIIGLRRFSRAVKLLCRCPNINYLEA